MIEGAARALVKIGVIDIILPFILVFTITFGILQRTKVLGENQRKSNIMLSLSLGLIAVLAVNVLDVINVLVRYLAVLIVTGVLIAIIYGLAGANFKKPSKMMTALLVILFGVTVFYSLAEAGIIDERAFFNTILLPLIVISGILATVMYIISKDEKEETKNGKKPRPDAMITRPELEDAENPESWSG